MVMTSPTPFCATVMTLFCTAMEFRRIQLLILLAIIVPLLAQDTSTTEILSVRQNGVQVANNSILEVRDRLSGNLSLQCVENVESGFTNLTWFILSGNGSLIIPSGGKDSDMYRVISSSNQANLTIDNSVTPFRGLVKCISSSGQVVSIRVVQDSSSVLKTCAEERDSVWGIQWSQTPVGNMDFQPCPPSPNRANGVALRRCSDTGDWNVSVDISNCSSESFVDLENMANNILSMSSSAGQAELNTLLRALISQLTVATSPKATTHFPRDLDVSNNILEVIVTVLTDEAVASDHRELVDVLDNLLHTNNTEGWVQLSETNNGSQRLLRIFEAFGLSLLTSLQNLQSGSLTFAGSNIVLNAMSFNAPNQNITYPVDLSRRAQITVPANILQQTGATGIVNIIITNLDDFLPQPPNSLVTGSNNLVASSTILSTQIMTSSGNHNFSNGEVVTLEIVTDRVPRAFDPVCVFWDANEGQWSREGVENAPSVTLLENGEIKVYSVRCTSNHLTAFAVAVDIDATEFDFSVPVYVGCGFIILGSVLSIFSLLLSCVFDGLRRYSLVAFLIHLSFIASVLCAYIAFLAGVEQALNNRIGCAAVAALLHYFFTAAFSWLFCEGLLLVLFQRFSKHSALFLLVFVVGWGLPAIPTAISLGILHENYGTTTQCWFFFDGVVSNDIVLAFIVPKLILIAATLLLLLIGCYTNCKFARSKMQSYIKNGVLRVIWLIWASVCIFLFFLAAIWVFALLLVNVFGIDSNILGWVFMVASITLSVWMFLFSAVTMVINQKVDYDRAWNSPDPEYPSSDPGRGKGYQFMSASDMDLSGRRTSTLTRLPPTLSNPIFGLHGTEDTT